MISLDSLEEATEFNESPDFEYIDPITEGDEVPVESLEDA